MQVCISSPAYLAAQPAAGATFKIGFNFRGTLGFVTDLGADTFANGDDYPKSHTSADTLTTCDAGFVGGVDQSASNYVDTNNAKLAGRILENSGTPSYFRVDLPSAGNYKIRAASAKQGYTEAASIRITDGAGGDLINVSDASVADGNYLDAGGNERTHNDWVANNTQVTVEFTGTELRMHLQVATVQFMNHLEIEKV